jgi:hypothetical protein
MALLLSSWAQKLEAMKTSKSISLPNNGGLKQAEIQ